MDALTKKVVARLHGIPLDECTRWQIEEFLPEVKVIYLLRTEHLVGVPDGTVLWSIAGERVVKGKDRIDADTRFGYLAYGLCLDDDDE